MNDHYWAEDNKFIARAWAAAGPAERDITLWRDDGWPFIVGMYVEVEIGIDGQPRSMHIHGYVIETEGDKVVIRGRDATNPRKIWAVT